MYNIVGANLSKQLLYGYTCPALNRSSVLQCFECGNAKEIMSWITSVYECHLCMHRPYLKRSLTGMYNLYTLRAACHWWSVCSSYDKQEARCRACFNLRCLRYVCQCCTLAVAQHCPSPIKELYKVHKDVQIFGKCLCAFEIDGIRLQKNKNKQTNIHMRLAMQSH